MRGHHVNGVAEFVKAVGPTRVAAMGAVAAMMVGFFAFIILRWQSPEMVPLFPEVTLQDSAQIVRELDRLQVKYELRNEGATILVPKAEVPKVRMRLAEQGLPKGGVVGYEIFDRGETLGTTSFVQNLNHLRALEGELARSIRSLDRVQDARVHLVIPERQIFARTHQEPTASVVLRVRGHLDQPQIRAIQHLVASAVPEMKPQAVSIIDETGQLLASGRADDTESMSATLEERRLAQEARLRQQVEDLLGKIVGPGRARVQVSAELDYNRITQTQDLFDPESRVLRSTQTRSEKSASQQPNDRQVTVGNELPAAQRNQPPNTNANSAQTENSEKNEETNNYEISRTQRQEVTEPGRLKRVTVAVLVDGTYQRQGDNVVYQPRPQEELDRIAAIVRSAVGFSEQRGDKVEVVNLRFADGPQAPALDSTEAPGLFSFSHDDIMKFAELGVMVVLALLMLLFVIRPLMKSILGEEKRAKEAKAAEARAALEAEAQAAIPASPQAGALESPQVASAERGPIVLPESATAKAFEIATVASQLHAQSVERITELVQGNPDEAVTIVRSWMNEVPQPAA